jgi:hypothetical protein
MRSGIVLLSVFMCLGCGHISDKSLETQFGKHETAFDELRDLFASDPEFVTIGRTRIITHATVLTSPPQGLDRVRLSPERYGRYLKLFDALSLGGGVSRSAEGVWFLAEAPSWVLGDAQKGYIYSLSDLAPCAADLDSYIPPKQNPLFDRGGFVVYKRLKSHWFLFKQAP